MGILVIGDGFTGKTQFINALAEPDANQQVKPIGWTYRDPKTIQVTPAGRGLSPNSLEVQVYLPSGFKKLWVEVMDTSGEFWETENRSEVHLQDWQAIKDVSAESEGIFLILPPYNEILRAEEQNHTEPYQIIPGNHSGGSKDRWKSRFQQWIKFFKTDCPKAQHILVCINKADLLDSSISDLATQFAYQQNGQGLGWFDRHQYLLKRHFKPIVQEIEQLSRWKQQKSSGTVQCFLTTIHHRSLLELPWIYLASYLNPDDF